MTHIIVNDTRVPDKWHGNSYSLGNNYNNLQRWHITYSKDGQHLTKGFKENVIAVSNAGASAAQTITFSSIANQALGAPHIKLASSTSLAVTNSVSGPATVSGSTLTLIRLGTVTVAAWQAGNGFRAVSTPPAFNPFVPSSAMSILWSFSLAGRAIISGQITNQ